MYTHSNVWMAINVYQMPVNHPAGSAFLVASATANAILYDGEDGVGANVV